MQKKFFYLKKIAEGIVLTLTVVFVLFANNKSELLAEVLLAETMPYYKIKSDMETLIRFDFDKQIDTQSVQKDNEEEAEPAFNEQLKTEIQDQEVPEEKEQDNKFIVSKLEDNDDMPIQTDIIGMDDVIFQAESDPEELRKHASKENLTITDIDKLKDLTYLRNKFYILDSRTDMTKEDFDVDRFLSTDLSMDISGDKPKVLIFHTHSTEMFKDSDPQDINDGVVGLGARLAQILNDKYGIKTIHDSSRYDMVDGKSKIAGAYERMEPSITKILRDNPSIEITIDIHRDGVNDETIRFVENVNGKQTAQIMFFNGLSKLNTKGVLQNIASLPNPNLKTNLAFSFGMQLVANDLYPNFTRKVYLNAYRYSLHLLPKSLLVEVGAQTNTKQEALNAMEPLAKILADVVTKK